MKEKTKARIVIILIISIIASGFGYSIGSLTSNVVSINLMNNETEKLDTVDDEEFNPHTIDLVEIENNTTNTTNDTGGILNNFTQSISDTGHDIWDSLTNWSG